MQPTHTMQLFMRREDGGMDVHDPLASGTRARAAAVMERGPELRARLQELFPGMPPVACNAAEGLGDALVLLHELREQGIAIGPYGLPQMVGIVPQNAEAALRPPAPASHLHSAFSKQASLNTRKYLFSVMGRRDKARLRSCGGTDTRSPIYVAKPCKRRHNVLR